MQIDEKTEFSMSSVLLDLRLSGEDGGQANPAAASPSQAKILRATKEN